MTPSNPPSIIPSPIAKTKPTNAHCSVTSAVQEFVSMTIVWDRAELQKFPIRRNNKDKEF
jgi:hypothetical protein